MDWMKRLFSVFFCCSSYQLSTGPERTAVKTFLYTEYRGDYMQVICQPVGPVEANCYIVLENEKALIIDPGADAPVLKGMIQSLGAKVEAVLLTHAHFDHIGAVDELVKEYGVDVYLNPLELDFLEKPEKNASASFMGIPKMSLTSKPVPFKEGKQQIGSFEVTAYYAPGHSAGSTILEIGDCLFTGDVLFNNSIGRTDLATGNADQMKQSLAFLNSLTKNYEVYPGHGPSTTLDREKKTNPYLIFPNMI